VTGRAWLVPAEVIPPAELPDEQFPMILTTGRQLEHWHTGAMTRRASNLDALEPEATAALNPSTLAKLGIKAGDRIKVATRRGSIELWARADTALQDDVIFVPFAYVEAAANLLTNPQLDPYGKIPEFKFCAARVENPAGQIAAE
jgi:formate dehydrogenase major subunit